MSPLLDVRVERRLGAFALDARFVSDGRLTALFGRSGSGKTSIVNAIAGLIAPDCGRVVVDGQVLVDTERGVALPKHRRRVGYVFQEARLFPHLTVRQNLMFGRWFAPKGETRGDDLAGVVDLLDVGALLERRPGALSGGEKQRIAIGRALLAKPRVLLMDEPLASLDEARKAEILPYIERMRDETRIPIVYVSHAAAEIARLATTVVVVEAGRVRACGPAADILSRLDIARLAGATEAGAVLDAEVVSVDARYGLARLSTAAGPLETPRAGLEPGRRLRVRILASDVLVSLAPLEGISALNSLPGVVVEVGAPRDGAADVRLGCGEATLVARVTSKSVARLALAPGLRVFATIKSVSIDAP